MISASVLGIGVVVRVRIDAPVIRSTSRRAINTALCKPSEVRRNTHILNISVAPPDKNALKTIKPMTLEGCVVRISDVAAYIGKDIEDAIRLRFLTKENMDTLSDMAKAYDKMAINLI
mgnify:CR=1 FL=1